MRASTSSAQAVPPAALEALLEELAEYEEIETEHFIIRYKPGIDRIMDMMRTTTNVTGDCTVALTVAQMTGEVNVEEMVSAEDV
jgi:Na+/H+-dicarboxylate symporter